MADVFIESLISNASGSPGAPATSLDRQELDALLDVIDRKTDSLEHMLFDTVKGSSDIFLNSWNNSHSTKSEVEVLFHDLDALQRDVYNDEDGIQVVVKTSLAEYNSIVDKVASNQNVINSLELLVPTVNQLQSMESRLKSGRLIEAQKQLEELENTMIEEFSSGQWNRVNAVHIIRKRIKTVRTHLLECLENCLTRNITFITQPAHSSELSSFADSVQMKVNYRFHTIEQTPSESDLAITLSEVFTCISDLGSLESYMACIKKNVYRHVIVPLLEAADRTWIVQIHQNNDGSAILEMKATRAKVETGDEEELDPLHSIQNVYTIFDFFYNYMFGQSVQPKEQNLLFGNLVVPDTFELLKTYILQPTIPSTIPKLNSYTDIANSVRTLEDKLIQYNFMANKNTASLSQFADNIDRYFSLKLKGKILVNARKVMLRKIYEAEPAKDPENGLQNTFVTQTPRLLLVLVQDTIDTAQQIAEQHPTSSVELWNAVNELVDLYRALMPTFHGEAYTKDYSTAMLFRNDCYWLASHLTKLQSAHTTGPQPLETSAQKLRQLGGIWYELTVGLIVSRINHILDGTGGFLDISQVPRMEEKASQAVTDSVDLVLRFSAMIQSVLSDDLFIQTITMVSDAIVTRLISDIEVMHDIGDEESHIIAQCLNSVMSLVDAFSRPGHPDATDPFVATRVKDWKKFWILRNMLEMSFRDIMQLFRDGELQCFETKELCDFLCALFADTDLRQTNLQEIQLGYQPQKHTPSFSQSSTPAFSNLRLTTQPQANISLWEPFNDIETTDENQDEGWEPFDDQSTNEHQPGEGWEPFDDQPVSDDKPNEGWEPFDNSPESDHAPEEGWEPFDDQHVEDNGSQGVKDTSNHEQIINHAPGEGLNVADHEQETGHALAEGWNLSDHEQETDHTPAEGLNLSDHEQETDHAPAEGLNLSDHRREADHASVEGWNLSDHEQETDHIPAEGLNLSDHQRDADHASVEGWNLSDHEQETDHVPAEGLNLSDTQHKNDKASSEGWDMSDHEQKVDDVPAHGWEPLDDMPSIHQPDQEGWEAFDDDAHIDKQPRLDVQGAHLAQEPIVEAVSQPGQQEDEYLWEPMDDPISEDQNQEGWEAFDDDITTDAPPLHSSHYKQTQSGHHNESPFASMLDQLSHKPDRPIRHDSSEENRHGDSFANLFGNMAARASSPKQEQHTIPRFGTPSIESSFSSLLGNLIGATPSPNPEQQTAKQSSSGLALPSLDAFGYASNRIAGEFTNVVGSMIGATPRQTPNQHTVSADSLLTAQHLEPEGSKSAPEQPKPTSKLDFVPQNMRDDGDEQGGEEEGGWDW
ncbi:Centromere/kinetochore Zw10-domain-containing protein [Umbelopsis sp. PMI_123]|nr:Centromere/kinetochore Zw10-domain-containing protein [Umbelopsis sp. PMI_123]